MKFRQKAKLFLKSNYIYIIMVASVIIRISLGHLMGAWYGVDQEMDDIAMFKGLSLNRITHPTELSLIKNLGFSVFLGITAITGLPYTVMVGILWSFSALAAWLFLKKVTDKKWVQLFGFLYILFMPIAFEAWGGLRVYRNSIIAPCIILTFSLLLILIVDVIRWKKIEKSTVIASLLAGLMFCFTYFLKEDGIWLKLTVAAMIGFCIVLGIIRFIVARKKDKKLVKKCLLWAVVCLVPFLVFFAGDRLYRTFNRVAFGVYEINTRTEGELGKFVYNIYKIDSPNRNLVVWAPYDAIEAAFEASPTLAKHPELLEGIMTTEWFDGDIVKNPIRKDFLTWVIRTELVQSGLWTSERDVNDMFGTVNEELKQAFDNGTLKKATGRVQIVSSIAGYSMDEIKESNLGSQLWWAFEDAVWLKGYTIGHSYDIESTNQNYNRVLNMDNKDLNNPNGKRREFSKTIAEFICVIYRIVNTGLFAGALIFVFAQIVKLIKHWKDRKTYFKNNTTVIYSAGFCLFFFAITFAYTLATAWFFLQPAGVEHYGRQIFIFYNVGVPALLSVAYVSALPGLLGQRKLV